MPERPSLRIAAPTPAITPPRSRMLSARTVVEEFCTDPVTGEQHFPEKQVRENVPGKRRPSHSKVYWFKHEVAEFFAKRDHGR